MKVELTNELIDIICKVNCFFENYDKTLLWMKSKNNNFGGCSPLDLINRGRSHKVVEFINDALDSNKQGFLNDNT